MQQKLIYVAPLEVALSGCRMGREKKRNLMYATDVKLFSEKRRKK